MVVPDHTSVPMFPEAVSQTVHCPSKIKRHGPADAAGGVAWALLEGLGKYALGSLAALLVGAAVLLSVFVGLAHLLRIHEFGAMSVRPQRSQVAFCSRATHVPQIRPPSRRPGRERTRPHPEHGGRTTAW